MKVMEIIFKPDKKHRDRYFTNPAICDIIRVCKDIVLVAGNYLARILKLKDVICVRMGSKEGLLFGFVLDAVRNLRLDCGVSIKIGINIALGFVKMLIKNVLWDIYRQDGRAGLRVIAVG